MIEKRPKHSWTGQDIGILTVTVSARPPEGSPVDISILVRSEWTRIGELMGDYLSQIGIKSTLRSADLNSWVAAKDAYEYDITVTRTTPWGMLMHANWGTGYFDSRRTGRGVLHILNDPEFLSLCDSVLATSDTEKLSRLGADVQQYYAEQLPGIVLYWNEIVTPFNKAYTGWKPDPLYGIYNVDTFTNIRKQGE